MQITKKESNGVVIKQLDMSMNRKGWEPEQVYPPPPFMRHQNIPKLFGVELAFPSQLSLV